MGYSLVLWGLALLFFILLLAAVNLGRHVGRKRARAEGSSAGAGAIEASVFALLGLLIAFTFSGAAQRMSDRRNLIVQEVNAIGTAWLRIDLLDAKDQAILRDEFRAYVDGRIDFYKHLPDQRQREVISGKVATLQHQIWAAATSASRNTSPPLAVSFIGAVNDMLDASTTLTVAQQVHPPLATYLFLAALALVSGFLIGLDLARSKREDLFRQVLYALVMTAALYIIIDYEFPRVGSIRIDQTDALLQSTRDSMGMSQGLAK